MKTDELLNEAKLNTNQSSISSAGKGFETEEKAKQILPWLKSKLLNITEWNANALMSSYELFDEKGKFVEDGKIYVGSFIRIKLKASGKYDWVRVIDSFDAPDEFVLSVKPTFDPTEIVPDKSVVSHFFTDESTNNFCLLKKDKSIMFYVIGLSEKMNTNETEDAFETARNVAVNTATYFGMQNAEWEKFCQHFIDDVDY